MPKSGKSRLVLLGIAAVAILALAVPAIGHGDDVSWNGTCNAGEFCVYRHSNFSVVAATSGTKDDHYLGDFFPNSGGITLNDQISSLKNERTANHVRWYIDAHQGGASICMNAGGQDPSVPSNFNDEISSHNDFTGSCP